MAGNLKKQTQKDIGSDANELMFYFHSDNIKESISYVNSRQIKRIELNPYVFKFKEKNIDFLQSLTALFSLSIVALHDLDISGISKLQKLKELYLDKNNTKNIDFSRLNLSSLNFVYSKFITGIEKNKNLTQIIVRNAPESFFNKTIFENFKQLKSLQIVQSNIPDNFNFLSQNKKLTNLEIDYCRNLIDIKTIPKDISNTLKVFKIGNCKKVESIDSLKKFSQLKWFALVDSIKINNALIFENMPKLDTLVVLGSSSFENGDLRNLKKKLKHLGIDNKRHYILK